MATDKNQKNAQPGSVTSEVGVRTMASDVLSVSQGNKKPEPELVVPPAVKMKKAAGSDLPKKKTGVLRTIITLLIFLALVWVGYVYVWPRLAAVLSPEAAVQ